MTIVYLASAEFYDFWLKHKKIERGGSAFTGFQSLLPHILLLLQANKHSRNKNSLVNVCKGSISAVKLEVYPRPQHQPHEKYTLILTLSSSKFTDLMAEMRLLLLITEILVLFCYESLFLLSKNEPL